MCIRDRLKGFLVDRHTQSLIDSLYFRGQEKLHKSFCLLLLRTFGVDTNYAGGQKNVACLTRLRGISIVFHLIVNRYQAGKLSLIHI